MKNENLEIVKATPMQFAAPYLVSNLTSDHLKMVESVMHAKPKRETSNYGGTDEILVLFENVFTLRRTESEKAAGEYVKNIVTIEKDRKDEANWLATGRKDSKGNEIFKIATETVVKGWKQTYTKQIRNEVPTQIFFPYPLKVKSAENLSLIVGCALTEFKNDQQERKIEKRSTIRKTGYVHLQICVNGKTILNTKSYRFEGIPARLLESDFKAFAQSMYNLVKRAADNKTGVVKPIDVNAIFQ
jgi:hypothetical protein